MFDNNVHDDSELTTLESRLNAAILRPSPEQRVRLLYACGEAAGRAQMKRRLRIDTAALVLCFCAATGLTVELLGRGGGRGADMIAQSPKQDFQIRSAPSPNDPPSFSRFSPGDGDGQVLQVASNFRQLLIPDSVRSTGPFEPGASAAATKRILTAVDRSLSGDL